ncbi:MAG: hypothetical protein ACO1NZ_18255 [Adhaeribacter sp.]
MKRAYLFLLILCVAFACEDQEAAPSTLTGKWEWIRTDGGIANHIHHTPQSTGKAVILELSPNQTYRHYVNGVLNSQGTFSLSKRKCIHNHQEKDVITFSSNTYSVVPAEMMIESWDDQYLSLSDDHYDGLDSQYRRVVAAGNGN